MTAPMPNRSAVTSQAKFARDTEARHDEPARKIVTLSPAQQNPRKTFRDDL